MKVLNSVQTFVQESVDSGVTSIEDVHKRVASIPLDFLARLKPLKEIAEGSKEVLNSSIGNVYESIRLVNQKVGDIAGPLLGQSKASEEKAIEKKVAGGPSTTRGLGWLFRTFQVRRNPPTRPPLVRFL